MNDWIPVRSCQLGPECNCCVLLATLLFQLGFPAVTTMDSMEQLPKLAQRLYLPRDQVSPAWNALPPMLQALYRFNEFEADSEKE
jgi:hypothetical protein